MRRLTTSLLVVLVAALLAGCTVDAPYTTSEIVLVSQGTQPGYRYEYYENHAYSCGASGWQTFLIVWKDGLQTTAPRPLWIRLHGGGVGAFDETGQYVPASAVNMLDQEPAQQLGSPMYETGLTALARAHPAGFRFLFPSLCDHDLYAGVGMPDPNNPNPPDANGNLRATDGLLATKAAIDFARSRVTTTDTVLHGTSAGSYGVFFVAYGLEKHGAPVDAVVMDSGVSNPSFHEAMRAYLDANPGACPGSSYSGLDQDATGARFVQLSWPWWDPAAAVADAQMTTPILHLWDRRDAGGCGDTPIPYTDENGVPQQMAAMDLRHNALADAIDASGSTSANLRVCTDKGNGTCGVHTPTTEASIDADTGLDVNDQVMDWIDARLT